MILVDFVEGYLASTSCRSKAYGIPGGRGSDACNCCMIINYSLGRLPGFFLAFACLWHSWRTRLKCSLYSIHAMPDDLVLEATWLLLGLRLPLLFLAEKARMFCKYMFACHDLALEASWLLLLGLRLLLPFLAEQAHADALTQQYYSCSIVILFWRLPGFYFLALDCPWNSWRTRLRL